MTRQLLPRITVLPQIRDDLWNARAALVSIRDHRVAPIPTLENHQLFPSWITFVLRIQPKRFRQPRRRKRNKEKEDELWWHQAELDYLRMKRTRAAHSAGSAWCAWSWCSLRRRRPGPVVEPAAPHAPRCASSA
eukprot:scaffold2114_cov253-Pinguiococcus_pyrenoidosus.AAC.26